MFSRMQTSTVAAYALTALVGGLALTFSPKPSIAQATECWDCEKCSCSGTTCTCTGCKKVPCEAQ